MDIKIVTVFLSSFQDYSKRFMKARNTILCDFITELNSNTTSLKYGNF
jgi:hypothetical protein